MGVIGQSGITYDESGNATGQIDLATQSWPGYVYQIGSVEEALKKMISIAKSWWPLGGPTAIPPLWFPPLDNCTVTTHGPATPCPGPGDLMQNAKQDLVNQLMTDSQCLTAAQQFVL